VQKNGLSAQQEMARAQEKRGITLTQNSYGIHLGYYCGFLDELAYLASDYNLDLLTNTYPTLQHIFAAGNDQTSCQPQIASLYGKEGYGTSGNRSKNSLHVGAVDKLGAMTEFSSWGRKTMVVCSSPSARRASSFSARCLRMPTAIWMVPAWPPLP